MYVGSCRARAPDATPQELPAAESLSSPGCPSGFAGQGRKLCDGISLQPRVRRDVVCPVGKSGTAALAGEKELLCEPKKAPHRRGGGLAVLPSAASVASPRDTGGSPGPLQDPGPPPSPCPHLPDHNPSGWEGIFMKTKECL